MPVCVAPGSTARGRRSRDSDGGFASEAAYFGGADVFDELPDPSQWRGPPRAQQATLLLEEQHVLLGLAAKGKRSALARIAAALGDRLNVNHGAILAAMLRRERLGSTSIGHGVAIPHARLGGITKPKVVMATLQRPVWFDAPDNQPVDLLLSLLWPRADSAGFLVALASFCRLLRHPELRACLRGSETPAEALAWMRAFEDRAMTASCGNAGRFEYQITSV
jgi:PTS system nitrogen regulatory IIA component